MMNEKEMRESEVPTFDTIEELSSYIKSFEDEEGHDYGTCVYAMSMAATAAFNYMARKLGVSGFQASCADLDIIRRTRHIECPFTLIFAEDELFPQSNVVEKLQATRRNWKPWVVEQAKLKLEEEEKNEFKAHKDVKAHWEMLAGE